MAPPVDAGPEAKDLKVSIYESAWDKPFDPTEPKWIPPPLSPLPKGYVYTPPAPTPPPPEVEESSSESEEEETGEVSGYSTSDSEGPERRKPKIRYTPVFPWETRVTRRPATRVFPGDEPPKEQSLVVEPLPSDRRSSLENYEFTNA